MSPKRRWRRAFVLTLPTLLALPALFFVTAGLYAWSERTIFVNEQLVPQNSLHIPPLLDPETRDGRRIVDLVLQRGASEILPGRLTETWGINGPILGPTISLRKGEHIALKRREPDR